MGDHFHGLCKNCLPKCTQNIDVCKKEDQCERCEQAQPDLIVQQEGKQMAFCLKCYLKRQSSPLKTERSSGIKQSPMFNPKSSPIHNSSLNPNFSPVSKQQMLSKSLFSSEGKMIKKIQKYFTRYEGKQQQSLKDLGKKGLAQSPITWQTLLKVTNRVGSLMFVLANQNYIVGLYHQEPTRPNEKKGFLDTESGFFIVQRPSLQLQFYKANTTAVFYNNEKKSVELGKPVCFQMGFQGKQGRIVCDLLPFSQNWPQQYIYKL